MGRLSAGDTMDHPGEVQLQRYLDAKLDEEDKERLRSHLRACAECHALLDLHARLSDMVRSSLPDSGAFMSEGEFWTRISGRLSPRPAPRWPLLHLLPPLVLASFGSALQMAFTVVVGLFGLGALGLLPAPAPLVTQGLSDLLGSPLLANTLYAWLGWSSEEVIRSATAHWGTLSAAAQHGLLLGAIVVSLVAALAAVIVLYLTWALCWPGVARRATEGGK